jgi:hypothetical protein
VLLWLAENAGPRETDSGCGPLRIDMISQLLVSQPQRNGGWGRLPLLNARTVHNGRCVSGAVSFVSYCLQVWVRFSDVPELVARPRLEESQYPLY